MSSSEIDLARRAMRVLFQDYHSNVIKLSNDRLVTNPSWPPSDGLLDKWIGLEDVEVEGNEELEATPKGLIVGGGATSLDSNISQVLNYGGLAPSSTEPSNLPSSSNPSSHPSSDSSSLPPSFPSQPSTFSPISTPKRLRKPLGPPPTPNTPPPPLHAYPSRADPSAEKAKKDDEDVHFIRSKLSKVSVKEYAELEKEAKLIAQKEEEEEEKDRFERSQRRGILKMIGEQSDKVHQLLDQIVRDCEQREEAFLEQTKTADLGQHQVLEKELWTGRKIRIDVIGVLLFGDLTFLPLNYNQLHDFLNTFRRKYQKSRAEITDVEVSDSDSVKTSASARDNAPTLRSDVKCIHGSRSPLTSDIEFETTVDEISAQVYLDNRKLLAEGSATSCFLHVTHIIPNWTTAHALGSPFFAVFNMLGCKLGPSDINEPTNAFFAPPWLNSAFDGVYLSLLPVLGSEIQDDAGELMSFDVTIHAHTPAAQSLLSKFTSTTFRHLGLNTHRHKARLTQTPFSLTSPDYLRLHHAICSILAMNAAAEPLDYEEPPVEGDKMACEVANWLQTSGTSTSFIPSSCGEGATPPLSGPGVAVC